jgi:hypothetical protein
VLVSVTTALTTAFTVAVAEGALIVCVIPVGALYNINVSEPKVILAKQLLGLTFTLYFNSDAVLL